jgi:hypothetical protein
MAGSSAPRANPLQCMLRPRPECAPPHMLLLLAPHPPAGGAIFTVPAMAQLLFNRSDAAACAAALRMLRDDRLYFKQVGRSPPMFSARSRSQVEALEESQRQQQQVGGRGGAAAACRALLAAGRAPCCGAAIGLCGRREGGCTRRSGS